MIDYLSLALGHGLLAIALLRLVMREELDVDPRIEEYTEKTEADRAASTVAGRASRRNAGAASPSHGQAADANEDQRS